MANLTYHFGHAAEETSGEWLGLQRQESSMCGSLASGPTSPDTTRMGFTRPGQRLSQEMREELNELVAQDEGIDTWLLRRVASSRRAVKSRSKRASPAEESSSRASPAEIANAAEGTAVHAIVTIGTEQSRQPSLDHERLLQDNSHELHAKFEEERRRNAVEMEQLEAKLFNAQEGFVAAEELRKQVQSQHDTVNEKLEAERNAATRERDELRTQLEFFMQGTANGAYQENNSKTAELEAALEKLRLDQRKTLQSVVDEMKHEFGTERQAQAAEMNAPQMRVNVSQKQYAMAETEVKHLLDTRVHELHRIQDNGSSQAQELQAQLNESKQELKRVEQESEQLQQQFDEKTVQHITKLQAQKEAFQTQLDRERRTAEEERQRQQQKFAADKKQAEINDYEKHQVIQELESRIWCMKAEHDAEDEGLRADIERRKREQARADAEANAKATWEGLQSSLRDLDNSLASFGPSYEAQREELSGKDAARVCTEEEAVVGAEPAEAHRVCELRELRKEVAEERAKQRRPSQHLKVKFDLMLEQYELAEQSLQGLAAGRATAEAAARAAAEELQAAELDGACAGAMLSKVSPRHREESVAAEVSQLRMLPPPLANYVSSRLRAAAAAEAEATALGAAETEMAAEVELGRLRQLSRQCEARQALLSRVGEAVEQAESDVAQLKEKAVEMLGKRTSEPRTILRTRIPFLLWMQFCVVCKHEASLKAACSKVTLSDTALERARLELAERDHQLSKSMHDTKAHLRSKTVDLLGRKAVTPWTFVVTAFICWAQVCFVCKHEASLEEARREATRLESGLQMARSEIAERDGHLGECVENAQAKLKTKAGVLIWHLHDAQSIATTFQSWTSFCEVCKKEYNEAKLKYKVGMLLWRLHGPQTMLAATFQTWTSFCSICTHSKIQARLKNRAAMLMWQKHGPQSLIAAAFQSWASFCEACKKERNEALHRRALITALAAERAKLQNKAATLMWQLHGAQNIAAAFQSWTSFCELYKKEKNEAKLKYKAGMLMWQLHGPQNMLAATFHTWTSFCSICKNEKMQATFRDKAAGMLMCKLHGPQIVLAATFQSWTTFTGICRDEKHEARLQNGRNIVSTREAELRKKAGMLMWKLYGPQNMLATVIQSWASFSELCKEEENQARAEAESSQRMRLELTERENQLREAERRAEAAQSRVAARKMARHFEKAVENKKKLKILNKLYGSGVTLEAAFKSWMYFREIYRVQASLDEAREKASSREDELATTKEKLEVLAAQEDKLKRQAEAQFALKATFLRKLGAQSSLGTAFESWSRLCTNRRLEAETKQKAGMLLFKTHSPQSIMASIFLSWAILREISTNEVSIWKGELEELRTELANETAEVKRSHAESAEFSRTNINVAEVFVAVKLAEEATAKAIVEVTVAESAFADAKTEVATEAAVSATVANTEAELNKIRPELSRLRDEMSKVCEGRSQEEVAVAASALADVKVEDTTEAAASAPELSCLQDEMSKACEERSNEEPAVVESVIEDVNGGDAIDPPANLNLACAEDEPEDIMPEFSRLRSDGSSPRVSLQAVTPPDSPTSLRFFRACEEEGTDGAVRAELKERRVELSECRAALASRKRGTTLARLSMRRAELSARKAQEIQEMARASLKSSDAETSSF